MATLTVEETKKQLADLVENLQPGEEVLITHNEKVVARLIGETRHPNEPRRPGTLRGTVLYMAPDFNAPLDEFNEYMP